MTLPTLREVLALPQFAGAQVLSGQGALDADHVENFAGVCGGRLLRGRLVRKRAAFQ